MLGVDTAFPVRPTATPTSSVRSSTVHVGLGVVSNLHTRDNEVAASSDLCDHLPHGRAGFVHRQSPAGWQ